MAWDLGNEWAANAGDQSSSTAVTIPDWQQGLNFQDDLKRSLLIDPGMFYKQDPAHIAETLRGFKKSIPEDKLLLEIYKAFNLQHCHSYMADELADRIEYFKRIDKDPLQKDAARNWQSYSDEQRLDALKSLHRIQSDVYGFPPDSIEGTVRRPRYLNNKKTISNGSHDTWAKIVYINTYQPAPFEIEKIPSFRLGYIDAAVTISHEGIHTKQGYFGNNLSLLNNPGSRNVAEIMEMSMFGDYYLNTPRVTLEEYKLNPCEQEAFDFQNDMEFFMEALPSARKDILNNLAQQRQWHLQQVSQDYTRSILPQAYAYAAE